MSAAVSQKNASFVGSPSVLRGLGTGALGEPQVSPEELAESDLRASISMFASGVRNREGGLASELRRLVLVVDDDVDDDEPPLDLSAIEREFPTIAIERTEVCPRGQLLVDDFAWRGAFEFRSFDEAVEQARPLRDVVVRGSDAAGVAMEVMARYQRLVGRRNELSSTPLFDAVLSAHASFFEDSALGRAELEHALDTWQWMLRLRPDVDLAPQVAALFHDVDRLGGEPHDRIEHRAFRTADEVRTSRGAERVLSTLLGLGMSATDARRVRDLVAGGALGEPDATLLDDAESLSFLSLFSPRYADHFGLAQTRRKVSFTLGRLGPSASEKVGLFRLRPDVDRLVQPG